MERFVNLLLSVNPLYFIFGYFNVLSLACLYDLTKGGGVLSYMMYQGIILIFLCVLRSKHGMPY